MRRWRLFAVLGIVLALVTGCESLLGSSEPVPAKTPQQVFEQVVESKPYEFKNVTVIRETEDGVETLEAVTTILNCDVELEFVLGSLSFRVGEVHLTKSQAKGLKDDQREPDWPNEEVSGGPDNINPTRADVEKLLKSPPPAIKAMVQRCRR